jgi:hypothetical protein
MTYALHNGITCGDSKGGGVKPYPFHLLRRRGDCLFLRACKQACALRNKNPLRFAEGIGFVEVVGYRRFGLHLTCRNLLVEVVGCRRFGLHLTC